MGLLAITWHYTFERSSLIPKQESSNHNAFRGPLLAPMSSNCQIPAMDR